MGLLEFLSSNKDIISLIISFLNVAILVFFFISTRNFDLDQKEYEKKLVQFRDLILSTHQDKIENFFKEINDTSQQRLENIRIQLQNNSSIQDEKNRIIRYINEKKYNLEKNVGDTIFAFDNNLGSKFYYRLDLLQDEINRKIDKIVQEDDIDTEDFENTIRKNKILLFKSLHQYEPLDLNFMGRFNYDDPIFLTITLFVILTIVLQFF